jgi:hypothetical protein
MTYTSAIKRFDRYTTKFYKTPINANPANSSSAMDLSKGGQILCSTCHGLHYADSNSSTFDNASSAVLNRLVPGDGFLLRTDMRGATPGAINICTNCHKGKKSHNARGQNIQCADCHAAHVDEADGTVPNVWLLRRFMVYSTGTNKLNNRTNGIPTFFQSTSTKNYTDAKGTGICQSCHAVPVTVAGMSHPTVNCNNCHSHDSASGTFAATLPEPHYSDSTASYVAKNSLCTDCHNEAANNVAIRKSWAASGHADEYSFAWSAHDFKFQSGCVQCHTTTGFIAYSSGKVTAAWGNPADTTKELLACNACHTDIASGALRSPAIISPYLNNSYRNQDAGPSNICVGCHSGRVSGNSIKALSSVNTNFISSHLYAAAGILFNSIGYEFSDRDYSNKAHFKHDKIGINNYTGYGYSTGKQGPCIACHMSTANKHSFSPLTKDKSGVVTAISSTICVGCHTAPAFLNADRMNSRKARFSTSLLALQKMLENKGMIYVADHPPYFYNSLNTAAAFTNWGSADTMGAAFNLHLLTHEPGAYAHNMVYAKRLIYDSIDYLDDGEFNSSVSAAVNALTSLEEAQKSTAIGYLTKAGARP